VKRIIIICEGETEQEFCTSVLSKYFAGKEIFVDAPLIKKSMGGIVKWPVLKREIENFLKNDRSIFVTTLIDFYGLYKKFGFPQWDNAGLEQNKNRRLDILENAMYKEIDEKFRNRFIPYIQLHEFEGLLFSNEKVFYEQIPGEELIGRKELSTIFKEFDNTEMINDNPENSPSKRLKRIIKGYNKIVYGNILAEALGIEKIRMKCPRFNNWIIKLGKL
jgi:hypothetical protein